MRLASAIGFDNAHRFANRIFLIEQNAEQNEITDCIDDRIRQRFIRYISVSTFRQQVAEPFEFVVQAHEQFRFRVERAGKNARLSEAASVIAVFPQEQILDLPHFYADKFLVGHSRFLSDEYRRGHDRKGQFTDAVDAVEFLLFADHHGAPHRVDDVVIALGVDDVPGLQ